MVEIPSDSAGAIPSAEVEDVELYHPKSWWTKYVFSQDAKIIAVQYSLTGIRRSISSHCRPSASFRT
ncbi:hypothetical protein [Rhizobium laguerreae]|uniref:hypothetical protein n=1 Tax=Rhizobium laguerreae TaxID=1076926 RepID=UPI001FEA4F68|nr:hypothetical protein [Rhizobium laguerreae]